MTLVIPAPLMSQLITDARQRQPQEACGLLLGTGLTVQRVHPLPNSDPHSEQGFILDPQLLVKALYAADEETMTVVGVYHSHPRSASFPSDRDIQGAAQWPKAAQVIVSLRGERPHIQAWQIRPGQVERIDITYTAPEDSDQPLTAAARLAIMSAALLALLILIGLSISLLPAAPIITPVP
jgi:proteasome lid subunit RPN8/RPN11